MLEAQQLTIDGQQRIIEELQEAVESIEGETKSGDDEFILYAVEPNDSLGKICSEMGIDYWNNRSTILKLNNIKDENVIFVGQILVFPSYMKNA